MDRPIVLPISFIGSRQGRDEMRVPGYPITIDIFESSLLLTLHIIGSVYWLSAVSVLFQTAPTLPTYPNHQPT